MSERANGAHPERWPVAPHVKYLQASVIRELLKVSSQPGVISFAGGLPAPELFPLEQIKEICSLVIEKHTSVGVQYSLSRGVLPFRQLLAERSIKNDAPAEADNFIITTGSQQGIEILARTFIDPGDFVLTENPTYLGALQAFNFYRARYATVEMDDHGMIVDQVEAKIRQYNPKLIYSVSNFQNPTGITMSAERRLQLVEIAAKYDIPVVDDNPYGEIRFAGEPVPSLKSLGGEGVIELQTTSKLVAPGLRIGWMNGPKTVVNHFEKVRQCVDLHSSTFNQFVIYEFMNQGYLEPHIERIKADYLAKRQTMLKTLDETFPKEISWTRPDGGLFLWLTLPEHMNATELFTKAIEMKVAYVPGQPFFPHGEGQNTLRMNFSNCTQEGIVDGVTRLSKLFKDNL